MPYTHEVNHIKLVGLQDRRRKLTNEQKAEIIRLRNEGWSLMKLAKEFEVSKKLILDIVNPESKAKHDKYIKDHWREFQQTREEHNEAVKKTRRHRQELFLKGELKINNKSLMERLLEAGYPPEDIDHYYSDLYVYVTPLTTRIIMEWADENGYDSNLRDGVFVQTFKDQITGRKMYDIAFEYIPFWKGKEVK